MFIKDYVSVRTLEPNDLNFILDSALESLSCYTESLFKGWTKKDSTDYLNDIILAALNYCDYSVFVAVEKEKTDHIVGYFIGDVTTNHVFLQYTKFVYRGYGIQKELLMPLVIDFDKPISVNWQTKPMLKLQKEGKITIVNKAVPDLLKQLIVLKGETK